MCVSGVACVAAGGNGMWIRAQGSTYSKECKQVRTWLHGSPVLPELLHNPCSVKHSSEVEQNRTVYLLIFIHDKPQNLYKIQ